MKKQTLGTMIAALRRERGMTQLELAEKMGVTDKAVSKWERDLSCPDVNSLPRLAELFGVSVDELMQVKLGAQTDAERRDVRDIVALVCKAVALAMGVAVVALSLLKKLDTATGVTMLGLGLACVGIALLGKERD